ncbi:hypothetical protein D9619_011704 [Psilocybe cf. subviscida]|uniref:Rho-GAP domain-containing protein n=1 Tax=Psilocybe cf. subviscida TaxID=2480587 RepID=A0A8H5BTA5_9AGAR|nr:hypothetical protein D9619_011704 [Psilocybe cf. subviscida]
MSYTHSHQANTTHPVGVAPSHAPSGVMPPSSSLQPSSGPQPATLYASSETGQFPSISTSSSPVNQRQQAGASTVAPRTTSLPFTWQMGSSQSKSSAPVPPPVASSSSTAPSTPSSKGFASTVAGGKLKRAFARRRKDAEPSPPAPLSKGKEPDFKAKAVLSSPSLPIDRVAKSSPSLGPSQHSSPPRVQSTPPRVVPSPNPRTAPTSPSQVINSSRPPPLPKKDTPVPTPLSEVRPSNDVPSAGSRNSIMPISPGISSAVTYISMMDQQQQGVANPREADKENVKADLREDNKESWRKSDSTNSHHTVRPGGSKSSRPVSWAESFQSSHTVVQSSRRRSALVGDADFGMAEEEEEEVLPTQSPNSSPSAIRSRNRRSMSLNIDMTSTTKFVMSPPPPSVPVPDLKRASLSISEGVTPVSQRGHAPSLSDSQPYIEPQPSRFMTADPSVSSFSSTQLPPHARNLQYAKPPPSSFLTPQTPATAPTSFRQTAISIGVGPAAAGLAKRAVEKMGRKWGISSSTSGSGAWSTTSTSSSATTGGPSSYSGSSHMGEVLVRTSSNQSTPSVQSFFSPSKSSSGKHTRTGGAAGSISSSDMEPVGPVLGKKLRGALRSKNGVPVASGVLFGRDLATGVRETGIHVGKVLGAGGPKKEGLFGEFEERRLAAVVVRCAQHLLRWGVQEEGLFRVNGRPTHLSKLRAEYDSGADYDMLDCSPGDLDPHAVSSVFKAYLRELPEPILTHRLQPLFDAAVNEEAKVNAPESTGTSRQSTMIRGQGLPSGPKANFGGLRKPPSLSTLAMPSFHGIPPASKALLATLRGLIKQLPEENRDLVRTVVDLIKETSKVKETKMPVSNLLVVFCPSLNLTPPLLKVLCEAEGIWSDRPDRTDMAVIDIKRAVVPVPIPTREDDARSDTTSTTTESDSLLSMRPSLDDPSDYHASAEESIYEGQVMQRPREEKYERAEVPTVYLDSRSQYTSSSASFPREQAPTPDRLPYMQHAGDNGSISSDNCSVNDLQSISPPLLSSSAESVATPITSSNPSFSDIPVHSTERVHDPSEKPQRYRSASASGPEIVSTSLELRPQTNKRPKISEPIPISGPVSFPVSPKLAPVAARRRSIPLLSNISSAIPPQLGGSPSESPAPSPKSQAPQEQRAKKPSLKLLFSKKSTSSLSSLIDRSALGKAQISGPFPAGYSPKAGSDSSVSTPISAVTAPQSSVPGSGSSCNLPHIIDTPIDESALSLSLGLDLSTPATATSFDKQAGPTTNTPIQAASSRVNMPEIKPLAINSKRTIKPGENHLRAKASTSNMSVASTASSHRLSLFEDDEDERMENWTQSVLLAADAKGTWTIQKPSSSGTNAKA